APLPVALVVLSCVLPFQAQTGIAQLCLPLPLNLLTVNFLALAHDLAFFRPHLHPAFGVFPKCLSIFRRHRAPTIGPVVKIGRLVRRGQPSGGFSLLLAAFPPPPQKNNRRHTGGGSHIFVSLAPRIFFSVVLTSA